MKSKTVIEISWENMKREINIRTKRLSHTGVNNTDTLQYVKMHKLNCLLSWPLKYLYNFHITSLDEL